LAKKKGASFFLKNPPSIRIQHFSAAQKALFQHTAYFSSLKGCICPTPELCSALRQIQ